ncbi:MAG TPA: hypothetical protein VEA16_07500, partial [Vicinamibacterales bacterium]|nr:hypothetical protein [Vicinamibacterales bacterium]
MIDPQDSDDTVRHLLRQVRPDAVDAARAARVRHAVHAAWKDAADRRRRAWKLAVAIAAAAVLAVALTPMAVKWVRERGAQPAVPVASTLFATGEVVFDGGAGRALLPGTSIATNGGRAAIALANGVELRLDANTVITV